MDCEYYHMAKEKPKTETEERPAIKKDLWQNIGKRIYIV